MTRGQESEEIASQISDVKSEISDGTKPKLVPLTQKSIPTMFCLSGGDMPDVPQSPGGLLGADFSIENGRYKVTRIYDNENWNPDLRSPLSTPGALARFRAGFLLPSC